MKSIYAPLLATSLLATLSACQNPMGQPIGGFGDAVRHNLALQVIDPEPLMEAPPPELDGARAALAFTRYQNNQVQGTVTKVTRVPRPTGISEYSVEKEPEPTSRSVLDP